jgi:hypothetical protein
VSGFDCFWRAISPDKIRIRSITLDMFRPSLTVWMVVVHLQTFSRCLNPWALEDSFCVAT